VVDSLQRQVQARMVGLLQTLAVEEGYTLTPPAGVRLLRSTGHWRARRCCTTPAS
jgi:hypothetical protein